MRKFQRQSKPPRVKKYIPWWKKEGDWDATDIQVLEDRMCVFGTYRGHSVVINLPAKCKFDTDMLIMYINTGHFVEVGA